MPLEARDTATRLIHAGLTQGPSLAGWPGQALGHLFSVASQGRAPGRRRVHRAGWAPGGTFGQPIVTLQSTQSGVQIHFLPGFNKSNFEKETGNCKEFHLLIKGNKR